MTVTGLIVEYNPLHNGHLYHLQESVKQTNATLTIAVMSGNFLQRGEPALVSKWVRTKMALKAGIDIVLELPYHFATQKAEVFANGAVSILDAMAVDHICFGSEEGRISPFQNTVHLLSHVEHRTLFDTKIKNFLSEGYSYPKAASLAFKAIQRDDTIDLAQSNNILGFHYVKAIIDQHSSIVPQTIKRTSSQYHDEALSLNPISSATSIRKQLFSQNSDTRGIERAIPKSTLELLQQETIEHPLANWETFFPFLKYRLLSANPKELSLIYEAEEGLENRLLKYIGESASFIEFMEKIKTKRYTWTRLQRLCLHILTNSTKQDMQPAIEKNKANYIRLLGMNNKGQAYLNEKKHDLALPLITKVDHKNKDLLNQDIKAAQCYDFITSGNTQFEFQSSPIRYNEKSGDFH